MRFAIYRLGIAGLAVVGLALTATPSRPRDLGDGFAKGEDNKYPPGSSIGPYRGFGYEWENNQLGIDHQVPSPWIRVSVQDGAIKVWGREFNYGKAAFPRQITSQGIDLLAAPIQLLLKADGKEFDANAFETKINPSTQGDLVKLTSSGKCGASQVDLESTISYDGLLKCKVRLTPGASGSKLEKLVLNIPYRREAARYFSRFFNYDFAMERAAPRSDILKSAGAIQRRMAMPVNHHIWIGTHKVGAEWSAETNKDWSNADENSALEIVPESETVTLQVNIVTKPRTFGTSLEYLFGLYVNPIKPMPKNWRARITGFPMQSQRTVPPGYDPKLWTFSTTRIGPAKPSLPLEYPGLFNPPTRPKDLEIYRRIRGELKANKIQFIPYGALMTMHAAVPELRDYQKYWLMSLDDRGSSPQQWKSSSPNLLDRGKNFAFGVSLYPKSVQDFLIDNALRGATEWGQDGLFYDIAASSGNVTNPNAAPVGGQEGVLYNPVFAVHDFHERLYKVLKGRNPNFIISQHHSKIPVLFGGFSDIIFSGEAMNSIFKEAGEAKRGSLPQGMPPYLPDYSLFSDDYWLATYNQSRGFAQFLFPQVVKWNPVWGSGNFDSNWGSSHPMELARWTRTMLSRTVVLDIPCWRTRMDFKMFDNLMIGLETFGGLVDPLTFIHPLDSATIRSNPAPARIMTSAYLRPERKEMLLIVANWADKPQADSVTLNFLDLKPGFEKIGSVTDIEGRQAPAFDDKSIKFSLSPNDFRVFLIQ